MTAPAAPDTPAAAAPAAPASPAPSRTTEAIAAARQRIAQGESLVEPAGEVAAPAARAEETKPADLTVTLPGMEERGEQPLELDAPDQETYERLNRLNNEAGIGRQVKQERREIQRSRTELAEVEDKIALDPTGFVLEQLPEQRRAELAMQMFFEPGVLEAIQQQLGQGEDGRSLIDIIEDPDRLRTLRAELKASRLEMRDRLHAQHEAGKAMQANAKQIIAEIDRLVPTSLAGAQRERVFEDAVRDIRDRCRRLGLTQLDPADVRPLVEARLRALGPMTARRSSAPAAAPSRPARPAAPGGALPQGTAARIALAKKIGLEALLERARATT